MFDFLENHALRNVWCAPAQDKEAIVQPQRISPKGGVWNQVRVGWRTHVLPLTGKRFHVYQIGQLHPLFLGLPDAQHQWVSFTDACNQMTLIADLYVDSGIQLPRFEAWFMVDADKNLIIAVLDPKPLINVDLNTQPLCIRVYTNAYYQSIRSDPRVDYIKVVGKRPLNTDAILALQQEYATLDAEPGVAYAFVNGYRVSTIDLFTVQLGDAVEYIYDASIYKVVEFTIANLRTFDSTLDSLTKYLLHYAGVTNEIDYQDDIDLFLMHTETNGRQKGVYVHRNAGNTLRMVTHKDYAVAVNYLVALKNYQPTWTDMNALKLRMHIRYSGWHRPLVDENSRIKELYKLSDADVRGVMLGIDSNVAVWRADALEASAYTAIMRAPQAQLAKTLVEDAYGYNAISKLLADTPSYVYDASGQNVIDVPYGLQSNAYGYEYDENGVLLGYHSHSPAGALYAARDSRTQLIEMIAGIGDTQLDETYGVATQTLDPDTDYRMYTCGYVNDLPDEQWVDVTGSAQYAVLNNQLTWLVDPAERYTLVRGNHRFLAYSLDISPTQINDGVLRFTLTCRQRRGATIQNYVMSLPMGVLDLWLNGHPLIEGVDYVMNFPQVVITSKEYLNDPLNQDQHLDIRYSNHCTSALKALDTLQDKGWISYDLLSRNGKYNIRDDKVLRIVAGGRLFAREDLKFAEVDAGVSLAAPLNGKPYLIRDIVVPMRGQTLGDTYTMRAESLVIDKAISDYLTLKIPEAPVTPPSTMAALYRLYSPFLCKLIYDLNSGVLDDPRMYEAYTNTLVVELCKPYEWLLAFDPATEALKQDPQFTVVHPHNLTTTIDIGIYQHKFLTAAVKQYFNNQVNLSGFLRIKDYQTES